LSAAFQAALNGPPSSERRPQITGISLWKNCGARVSAKIICFVVKILSLAALAIGGAAAAVGNLPVTALRNLQTLRPVGETVRTSSYDTLLYRALPPSTRFDSLVAIKHQRILVVYRNGVPQKAYPFSLGDAPVGHKRFQGDERTPEGLYRIHDRNPNSICHKNLGISYPNDADRAYARARGRSPGGDIKIHGLPNGEGHIGAAHLQWDWTNGCLGVTDEEIDELYERVVMGSPILILP